MGDLVVLVVSVEVARWRGERRVRSTTHDNPTFIDRHLLDERSSIFAQCLTRHPRSNGHHDVDHSRRVSVDHRVAIHLEVTDRPLFVENEDADLAEPFCR